MRLCSSGLASLVFLIGLSGCDSSNSEPASVGQLPEEAKRAMENLPGAGRQKALSESYKKTGKPISSDKLRPATGKKQ
jgi:hypothetical protein